MFAGIIEGVYFGGCKGQILHEIKEAKIII